MVLVNCYLNGCSTTVAVLWDCLKAPVGMQARHSGRTCCIAFSKRLGGEAVYSRSSWAVRTAGDSLSLEINCEWRQTAWLPKLVMQHWLLRLSA